MTSFGFIIMIIVNSCMIWFHFECIMHLNKSYHIATNVCSRKSATTFGDLPDWTWAHQGGPSLHSYASPTLYDEKIPYSMYSLTKEL